MPEAETSNVHQPPPHVPPTNLSTKASEVLEPQESHWLIVTDDNGSREVPLGGDVYSIGRELDNNIRLCSFFVSRRHATLVRSNREDGSYDYQLIDGNLKGQLSANGIIVNGKRLKSHILKHDDEIIFGPKISAKYFVSKRQGLKSGPLDPLDVTLIDPSTLEQ
jgi:pSer/pThr/pTyr-binding forkhead associated (FHA) protein